MKGIDIPIEKIRSKLESNLFTENDFTAYGRVFRLESYNKRPVPARYTGDREYRDVLLDDFKDGICFFDVLPRRGAAMGYNSTVWICFALDLEKLFPGVGERATEYAHELVYNQLRTTILSDLVLITGLSAFRDYDLVDSNDNLQPYYLFRFEANLYYQDNC